MNVNKLAVCYENLKSSVRTHSYITIKDKEMIEIECCRKVLKFEDNMAELEIPCGKISIVGLGLRMKNFGFDNVKIYGKLHSIGFEEINSTKTEDIK